MCLLHSSPCPTCHPRTNSPDDTTWAVSTHSSTRPFAPMSPPQISFFIVLTKDMCGPVGSLLSKADPSTPPFPKQIVGSRHGTYPRFQLCMAVDPIHNRFAVALDLRVGQFSSLQFFKFKRGKQVPWFLCRPGPVGFCFLFPPLPS